MFYASDLITQYLPWYFLVSQYLKSFELPHWIPSIYQDGYPLLAQGETGVLSPINFLILILLPFPISVNFLYVVYAAIAISGMFLFLRNSNLDRPSSLMGALIFIISGFFLSRYFQSSIIFSAALLPWGFLIIKKSLVDKKFLIFLAPLIYLQITAGHLQIVFISIIAYIFYAILAIFFNKHSFTAFIKLLIVLVIGISLSSVQLLPSAKLFQLSERKNWDKNIIFSYSLPPSHLITYVGPNAFGVSQPGDDLGFRQFGGGFWEINITIWTLPLVLSLIPALLIILKKISNEDLIRTIIIFYLLWLGFTLLSFGGFFKPNLIFAKISDYPFRAPARFMLVSTFSLSVLAAVGFSEISKLVTKKVSILVFILIFIVTLFQITGQLKNYFVFKNTDFIIQDLKYSIESNNLRSPLIFDRYKIEKFSEEELEWMFRREFYKGAVLSLISSGVLVFWWKKER